MASQSIGTLVTTLIPTLGSDANIQEALRMYHYGDESYNSTNSNKANLPTNGIANYISDLQDAVTTLQTTTGIQESLITAKGDLFVGEAFEDVAILSLPTSPSPQGYVLTVDSATTTGLAWKAVEVTATNATTLSNKILTLPQIASGGAIVDSTLDNRRYLAFATVTSGINHLEITNAATGSGPSLSAIGTDTNIDLNLVAKGTGKVKIGGSEIATIAGTQTITNKTINASNNTLVGITTPTSTDTLTNKTLTAESTFFTTTTGTNRKIQFAIPSMSDSTTFTLTLPAVTSTLATTSSTQTLTSKTISGGLVTGANVRLAGIDDKTASYTLVATDANKLININSSSNLTITVPSGIFTAGDIIYLTRSGTGTVTIAASGTTITSPGGNLKLRVQNSSAAIICTASNTFRIAGDLGA